METPKKSSYDHIDEGCISLIFLIMGRELSIYQRADARQELDKLLSEKYNALEIVAQLKADKAELFEALESFIEALNNDRFVLMRTDDDDIIPDTLLKFETLIQKHKQ